MVALNVFPLILSLLIPPSLGHFLERDSSWIPKLTKSDLKDYTLVSRIPLTSLYKFTFYRDVSILYYAMPDDVHEARFFFRAHEDKISTLGGKCEPQDIDLHLKAGGFPVVSPQNLSYPEDFLNNTMRSVIISKKIKSDKENNTIVLYNPVPGDWFALAFVSWTNPKSDKIEQQGIATVCDTVLYTDLRIRKANVSMIFPNTTVVLTLEGSANRTDSIYKFYVDEEVSDYVLNLSVMLSCDGCKIITFTIQARSLPDVDNNLLRCTQDAVGTDRSNVTLHFNPYPREWHYLKLSYGSNYTLNENVKSCQTFRLKNDTLSSLHDPANEYNLVRDTKSEYFTFEYNLPPYSDSYSPSLFNVTSHNVTSLRFKVLPVQDIGGTLSIGVSLKLDFKYYTGYRRKSNNASEYYYAEDDQFTKLVVCLGQHEKKLPLIDGKCASNDNYTVAAIVVNNTDASTSSMVVHIPYPEVGVWYITFGLFCDGDTVCPCPVSVVNNVSRYIVSNDITRVRNVTAITADAYRNGTKSCKSGVIFSVSSSPCIEGKCSRNGICNYYMSGGFIYSTCRCRGGYAGWDCSDGTYAASASEILMSTLFLTLSNILFLPSIVVAIRRQYYTEALVFFATMFFSTFYHACDVSDPNYSFCIVRLSVLQYCDFFCGLLSFWVTLVAMAALDNRQVSLLHMFGAIAIAFGTELNKQALLVFLIPVVIGVCIVVTAWGIRCRRSRKMFPAKSYLVIYLPIGLILSAVGLVCFAFLQTNANYHIVHSVWHMVIALSILCLLPNRTIFFPKS